MASKFGAPGNHGAGGVLPVLSAPIKLALFTLWSDLDRFANEQAVAADGTLAETARILRSIPGIGPVLSTMLIAEMPELGAISGEQAAALTGLAPIAHHSGALRGKRTIA